VAVAQTRRWEGRIGPRYGASVRRIQRLLVALVVVVAGWGVAWVASSTRGRCNPDDLTGCDALGSVLLFLLLFGLPIVLLAVLIFLVLDIINLRGRWTRSGQHERDG
jgi:hypothetical protein